MKAVSSGRIFNPEKIYKVLISRYADPSGLMARYGGSPLFLIKYGVPSRIVQSEFNNRFSVRNKINEKYDMQAIEILLCDGAVPGVSHLSFAAASGRADIVAMLLACGVDPNARDKDGETALFNAYRAENGKKIRDLLFVAGADPDIVSNDGKKAQDMQVIGNFVSMWKKGSISAIDHALQNGVDVNMRLADNDTLLHDACKRLNFELVKVLFKHKVDPNVSGSMRYYPIACLCETIFNYSSRTNMRDVDRAVEIFKFMVRNGATITTNPRGYGGKLMNILWSAIEYYSQMKFRTVHYVNRKNRHDTVSNKLNKRYYELLIFMIDYTDDFEPGHWDGIMQRIGVLPQDIVTKLLDKIPKQIIRTNLGRIISSIENGKNSASLVYALARKGMDFNEVYDYGYRNIDGKMKKLSAPPLYIAVKRNKSPEVINALLKNGADPNWKDEDGNTALDITQNAKVRDLLRRRR